MTPEQVEMLLIGVENCCILLNYIFGLLTVITVYGMFKECVKLFKLFFGGR